MEIVRHTVVPQFIERITPLLLAREAQHNLILGLCADLRRNPNFYGPVAPMMYTVEEEGTVILVALQTPPYSLALSHTEHPAALPLLATALWQAHCTLPGVIGPHFVAEPFAQCWAEQTGSTVEVGMQQRIYQLTAVRPPTLPTGQMRWATTDDQPLLEAWFPAFHQEILGATASNRSPNSVVRWLTYEGRQLALWDDGGPVAMAGATGPTLNGIRISAVYTPPAQRRRGYASALVATFSQAQLDAGRRFCFLYTDLSNPISNHIYQAIGYTPVVDSTELRFRARLV